MTRAEEREIVRRLQLRRTAIARGEISGKTKYQPNKPELKTILQERREESAYRSSSFKERKKGIDLDKRAEEVWDRVEKVEEVEEFPLPACLKSRSWWPEVVEAAFNYFKFESIQNSTQRRSAKRKRLRKLFGEVEYPLGTPFIPASGGWEK